MLCIYMVRNIGVVNGTVYLNSINKPYTAFYTFCAIWIQFDIEVLLAMLLNVYKDREKRCSERHSLPTDVGGGEEKNLSPIPYVSVRFE
jgi:hypothetical protein